ncbi:MAG: response regulator transcription factor [Saprospiraceae bacterium]|nr:response regulator transcription factor [Saprospiraceae bacterium]
MKKNVFIVDDHALFSNSLQVLINQFDNYYVEFCAQNGKELIFKLQDQQSIKPDIILLDINMPVMNGVETMAWLSKNYPDIPVLILTMQDDDNMMLELIKMGIKGYLLKDITPQILQKALDDILHIGFYHSEKLTKTLISALNHKSSYKVDLKEKEVLFLQLICTEKTYKEIADEMHLSPKTIDGYRDVLFEKLDVRSRVGLVLYAIKNGIFRL